MTRKKYKMTLNEFLMAFYKYNKQHFNLRRGQNLMNFLHSIWPEMYDIITGSKYDCFYNDNKIDKTIGYLAEEWYTFEGKNK